MREHAIYESLCVPHFLCRSRHVSLGSYATATARMTGLKRPGGQRPHVAPECFKIIVDVVIENITITDITAQARTQAHKGRTRS